MAIVSEPAWEGVLEEVVELRGVVFLLGTTDSGKSTLARYLLQELTCRRQTTALVDADIGQSSLGLPGTVSMKVFRSPEALDAYQYERISFTGYASPVPVMPLLIEESGRMADAARLAAEIIVMDTTGLVTGTVGRALKLGKIRRVRPALIIAIQRYDELEHIIASLDDVPVRRLNPSPLALSRSQEARAGYRRRRLAGYFTAAGPGEFLLTLRDATFIYRNRPVNLSEARIKAGSVIGLNHNGETLGLGVLVESDDASVTFRSPLASLKGINRVVLGDITLEDGLSIN